MKTLEQIRELFVGARNLAREGSPATVAQAAENLKGISDHCKELYKNPDSTYLERAKCRNLYESIDNIIAIMKVHGYVDETVAAFFGLLKDKAKSASFSDITQGRGTVLARKDLPSTVPATPAPATDVPADVLGAEPVKKAKKGLAVPPPPAAAAPAEAPAASTAADLPAGTLTDDPAAAPAMRVPPPAPASAPADAPFDASTDTVDPAIFDVKVLDEFIGQTHITSRLKEEIIAARMTGRTYIDNILLFGSKGLGKSTLIKVIAEALGVRLEMIDCTTLMNNVKSEEMFHQFFLNICKRADEPVVIALDEIHKLPGKLQSRMLNLLESREYCYLGENGVTNRVAIPNFTFIGATTDYADVLGTLVDRCRNLKFMLQDYTREELCLILTKRLAEYGLTASPEVLNLCANRCRSSLRDVVAITKAFRTQAINRGVNEVTVDMVNLCFERNGLDAIGLEHVERQILDILYNEPSGFISEEALAARMNMDVKELKLNAGHLVKIGFICVTSRGRTLTQRALDYLKYGYYDFGDGVVIGQRPDPAVPAAPVAPVAPVAAPPAPAVPVEPAPVAVPPAPVAVPPAPVAPAAPAAAPAMPFPPIEGGEGEDA